MREDQRGHALQRRPPRRTPHALHACARLRVQGPFFLGQDISLVDITFVPMLERAVASLAYYKASLSAIDEPRAVSPASFS